jgi:hypothetical protein
MCHLENYTSVIKENTLLVRRLFDKFWESVSLTFLLCLLSSELVEKIIDVRELCVIANVQIFAKIVEMKFVN